MAPGMDGSLDPEFTCEHCKDTGQFKENCIKLSWRLVWELKETGKKVASYNITEAAGRPLTNPI